MLLFDIFADRQTIYNLFYFAFLLPYFHSGPSPEWTILFTKRLLKWHAILCLTLSQMHLYVFLDTHGSHLFNLLLGLVLSTHKKALGRHACETYLLLSLQSRSIFWQFAANPIRKMHLCALEGGMNIFAMSHVTLRDSGSLNATSNYLWTKRSVKWEFDWVRCKLDYFLE